MIENSSIKELQRLNNLLQSATENEQSITLNISLSVFNGILDYRVEQALENYKQFQELRAKENEQGDLVTPKEAKAILRVSDATLWRYSTKDCILTRKQVGGKTYYSRKEIQKIMEG